MTATESPAELIGETGKRLYTIRWRRLDFPGEQLECRGLTGAKIVSRMRSALRWGKVIVDEILPE